MFGVFVLLPVLLGARVYSCGECGQSGHTRRSCPQLQRQCKQLNTAMIFLLVRVDGRKCTDTGIAIPIHEYIVLGPSSSLSLSSVARQCIACTITQTCETDSRFRDHIKGILPYSSTEYMYSVESRVTRETTDV